MDAQRATMSAMKSIFPAERREVLAAELRRALRQRADALALAERLQAVISYLENEIGQLKSASKEISSAPSTPRGIPRMAEEIFGAEPRHMFVDELLERFHARGLLVKRSSVARSLSRDPRFKRYHDGWGLTVQPQQFQSGVSANPGALVFQPTWGPPDSTDPAGRPFVRDLGFRPPETPEPDRR
jgi:hypothetical protein